MLIERYRASVLEMYRFFVDFFFFLMGCIYCWLDLVLIDLNQGCKLELLFHKSFHRSESMSWQKLTLT